MPYIFINDGSPEASDYDSNYLHYDNDDIESMEGALGVLQARGLTNARQSHAEHRALVRSIASVRESQIHQDQSAGSNTTRLRNRLQLLWSRLVATLQDRIPHSLSWN